MVHAQTIRAWALVLVIAVLLGTAAFAAPRPPTPVVCGNGVVQSGEQCDAGAQNGVVCTPNYGSACQYCSATCTIITLQGGTCGDGTTNGPEQCDAGAQNGVACIPPYEGTCQYCSPTCQSIPVNGPTCGDNVINGPEQCDGTATFPQTCASVGLGTGSLSCYAPSVPGRCTFNTSACVVPISLASITPNTARIFTPISLEIIGTNLQDGDDVRFTGATGVEITVFDPPLTNTNHFSFALSQAQLQLLENGTGTVRVIRGAQSSNTLPFTVVEPFFLGSISPSSLDMESVTILTLTGTGFTNTDTIDVDGQAFAFPTVQFVGPHALSVSFFQPIGLLFSTGTHSMRVHQGSKISNAQTFTVRPVIEMVSPSYAVLDGQSTPISLTASGLKGGDSLRFEVGSNSVIVPATRNGITLQGVLQASDKATLGGGFGEVQVIRGAFISRGFSFDLLSAGTPTLLQMNPHASELHANVPGIQLQGTRFNGSTLVHVGTLTVTPISVIGTNQLTFSLDPLQSAQLGVGTHDVWVTNGSLASNRLPFTITDPTPQGLTIFPNVASIPDLSIASPLVFAVHGLSIESGASAVFYPGEIPYDGFTPVDMTVQGSPSNQIVGTLSPAELQALGYGVHQVVVTNGAQSSAPILFTINPLVGNSCGNGNVEYPGEACDPPGVQVSCITSGGYPGVQTCSSNCQSLSACIPASAPNALAGDSFVLSEVTFLSSSLSAQQSRLVEIHARDTRNPPGQMIMILEVRNEKGETQYTLPPIGLDAASTGIAYATTDVDPNHVLEPGKTYALFVSIVPDPSETVRGNNSSTVAFVAVQESNAVSVPDMPAWMSVLFVSVVSAGLYIGTRETRSQKKK